MSGAALALARAAAVLHALGNLLLAGSGDVLAATAVALCSLVLAAFELAPAAQRASSSRLRSPRRSCTSTSRAAGCSVHSSSLGSSR